MSSTQGAAVPAPLLLAQSQVFCSPLWSRCFFLWVCCPDLAVCGKKPPGQSVPARCQRFQSASEKLPSTPAKAREAVLKCFVNDCLEEVALELELSWTRHKPPTMHHPFQRAAILAPLSSVKIGPMRADSPSAGQPYWVRDPPLQWPSARIVHQGTWSRSRFPPSGSVQRSVLNSLVLAGPVEIVCQQDPARPQTRCCKPVHCFLLRSLPHSCQTRATAPLSSASIFHRMCSSVSGSAGSLYYVIRCERVPGEWYCLHIFYFPDERYCRECFPGKRSSATGGRFFPRDQHIRHRLL